MQGTKSKLIKAIVCQVNCVFMQKTININRFDNDHLLHLSSDDRIDIILFPELAWAGYNLQNAEQAKKVAVRYGHGEQFQYARKLALRTNAYVMFGYVQLTEQNGDTVLYDSAAIIDRNGCPLTNTRKTHLLPFDKRWGKQWNTFNSIQLTNCEGKVLKCGLPICYDIASRSQNPIDYKFGDYAKEEGCEVILFMTSWFDMNTQNSNSGREVQDYWIERLKPLTNNALFLGSDKVGKEYSFYLEKQIQFIGSSCAITTKRTFYETMSKTQEGTLKVQYEFEE